MAVLGRDDGRGLISLLSVSPLERRFLASLSGPVPAPSLASAPVLPPNITTPPPAPSLLAPLPSSLKKTRFCLLHVESSSTFLPAPAPVLPPIPIAIDSNGLPHIGFDPGALSSLVELCCLLDKCSALNTGYLLFHLWLKSKRPDLVAEFISFDDANPFEHIKLGGAIRDPSGINSSDHGNLTAVIRYYSPYVDTSGSATTLSFALSSDITVNTIFGLPMLCDLISVISLLVLTQCTVALSVHTDFPTITRAATSCFRLPKDCTFDPADTSRNRAASLCGLPPSSATSILALALPAPVLASATGDTSLRISPAYSAPNLMSLSPTNFLLVHLWPFCCSVYSVYTCLFFPCSYRFRARRCCCSRLYYPCSCLSSATSSIPLCLRYR